MKRKRAQHLVGWLWMFGYLGVLGGWAVSGCDGSSAVCKAKGDCAAQRHFDAPTLRSYGFRVVRSSP
ncbi:hypothetical protein L6R29_15395 [Myxococcota bacterium]|nr:hypothetical protein [Myxococcota bacterium]